MDLEVEKKVLEVSLTNATIDGSIPRGLLYSPDYLALSAANIHDFGERVRSLSPHAEDVITVDEDDRFVSSIKLVGNLTLGIFGPLHWVKVSVPVGEMATSPEPNHLGFFYDDIAKAAIQLESRSLPAVMSEDEDTFSRTLRIVLDEYGQELRLSDLSIEEQISAA